MLKNLVLLLSFLLGSLALAQKEWSFKTTLGVNLGQTFNQAFIGQQNGVSFSPGFQFEEVIRLYKIPHEWRTEFALSEAWTITTPQTVFIKSSDSLNLKSSYLYHAWGNFGPYTSAKLRTSMFKGEDVWASQYTYKITDAATGQVLPREQGQGSAATGTYIFHLTSPFLPLILEQDIGFFAQPYHEDDLLLEFRAGATGRENIAKGQRILTAVGIIYGDTPVRQLDNVYELGPSLGVHFKGEFFEKKLSFKFSCDTLWSFLQVPIASLDSTKQLSFDLSTSVGVNLFSWLSLHWQFKSIYNPAILDQVQLMSNLMLAVNL
ncbi:MAG: hypothetical protein WCK49_05955 [Myxococcaceae bacterium]